MNWLETTATSPHRDESPVLASVMTSATTTIPVQAASLPASVLTWIADQRQGESTRTNTDRRQDETTRTTQEFEGLLLRLLQPNQILRFEAARDESGVAKHRVAELATLPQNWDDEGAIPPTPAAIAETNRLIDTIVGRLGAVAGRSAVPWTIGPAHFGGLMPEWRGSGGELEVLIGPMGEVSYLWITVDDGDEEYVKSQNPSMNDLLSVIAHVLFE
jgi:hypothetical protein